MDRGAWWATVHWVAESEMTERLSTSKSAVWCKSTGLTPRAVFPSAGARGESESPHFPALRSGRDSHGPVLGLQVSDEHPSGQLQPPLPFAAQPNIIRGSGVRIRVSLGGCCSVPYTWRGFGAGFGQLFLLSGPRLPIF